MGLGCLLALIPFTGCAQTISPRTIIGGWRSAAQKLASTPAYVIEGQRTSSGPSLSGGDNTLTWRSEVADRLYHVSWKGSEAKQQSFDGERWFGLTRNEDRLFGVLVRNPQKSLGVNLDEHLASEAAGGFFVHLEDLIERPLNLGGRSLLQLVGNAESFYNATLRGNIATLNLNDAGGAARGLPTTISFERLGDEFFPTEIVFGAGDRVGSRSIQTKILDYAQVGTARYPRRIVEFHLEVDPSGKSQAKGKAEWQISANRVSTPAVSDFRIQFPSATRILDDSQTKPRAAGKL